MRSQSSSRFPDLAVRDGVLVVDGHGISIHVERGRLVVEDGVAGVSRRLELSRATCGLRRVVVLSQHGSTTLAALRWIDAVKARLVHIDRDGRVTFVSSSLGRDDARLRRAQAVAATSEAGVHIARSLIGQRLEGEIRNLANFDGSEHAQKEIALLRERLRVARTVEEVRRIEATAAAAYFRCWRGLEIRFGRADIRRLPEAWSEFQQRSSPLTSGPRSSSHPINTLLNYAFALLEVETTIACQTLGLDPGIGIIHADLVSRDSLSLDVMEAVRSDVEAWVLDLIAPRTFNVKDFVETPQGVCRLLPPMTHVLSATLPMWRRAVAPVTEEVAGMLARHAGIRVPPTLLTQQRRREGRDAFRRQQRSTPRPVRLARACEKCGSLLGSQRGRLCKPCFLDWRREHEAGLVKAGPAALARLRAAGDDPAHRPEVKRKIGERIGRRNAERAAWERLNGPRRSAEHFSMYVLPRIVSARTSDLARQTGLSVNYCATIKAGKHVPHEMHWESLLRGAEASRNDQ